MGKHKREEDKGGWEELGGGKEEVNRENKNRCGGG